MSKGGDVWEGELKIALQNRGEGDILAYGGQMIPIHSMFAFGVRGQLVDTLSKSPFALNTTFLSLTRGLSIQHHRTRSTRDSCLWSRDKSSPAEKQCQVY